MRCSVVKRIRKRADLRMEAKVFNVLLLGICWMHCVQSAYTLLSNTNFNCHRDVPAQPLLLDALAGVWYEIGRVPNMDVLKCLNVTVPDKADKDLKLELEYISTWDGSQRPVKENITFPWDNYTQNSIFNLYYDTTTLDPTGDLPIVVYPTVTYKVVYTNYKLLTFICGYSGISPVPLFKILSRQRELDQKIVDNLQEQLDQSQFGKHFVWTEQSQCNSADRPVAGALTIIVFTLVGRLFKWC